MVFNRAYRLEMQAVMLVFSTNLVTYRPFNLLTGSPTPPSFPCLNKYKGMYYVFIQCVTGGIVGLRQLNTCCQVPLWGEESIPGTKSIIE